jgi:hypothetical protein
MFCQPFVTEAMSPEGPFTALRRIGADGKRPWNSSSASHTGNAPTRTSRGALPKGEAIRIAASYSSPQHLWSLQDMRPKPKDPDQLAFPSLLAQSRRHRATVSIMMA